MITTINEFRKIRESILGVKWQDIAGKDVTVLWPIRLAKEDSRDFDIELKVGDKITVMDKPYAHNSGYVKVMHNGSIYKTSAPLIISNCSL